MLSREEILKIIIGIIADLNQSLFKDSPLAKSPDTILFGSGSKLDSLGLVNLIVALEQKIEDEYSVSLTIVDERAMSQSSSPFKTINSLADYVLLHLAEKKELS